MRKFLLFAACFAVLTGWSGCSESGPAGGDETITGAPPAIAFADGIAETSETSYLVVAEITSENGLREVRIEKTFPGGELGDETEETVGSFDDPLKYAVEKTISVPQGVEKMVVVITATDVEDQSTEALFTFDVPAPPVSELNGKIVDALAAAYAEFEETDKLPRTVVVDGITYQKGKYYEAAAKLLVNISNGVADEVVLKNFTTATYPYTLDTFTEDEVPMELVIDQSKRQLTYAENNGVLFANYVTYPHSFVGPGGETYNGQLSFDRSAVILLRAFAHYKESGEFPSKLSSWQSCFLRSVSNCNIASDVVTSALNTAIAGQTTAREKGEAIFYYVRDLVAYEYYYNSSYGAAATLNRKAGNCCDTSHVLIAMARAAGIPSRYVSADATYPSGSVFGHVWAELYIDGRWWLCDATGKSNTFGNHENWKSCVLKCKYNELPF